MKPDHDMKQKNSAASSIQDSGEGSHSAHSPLSRVSMKGGDDVARFAWQGRSIGIEYQWINKGDGDAPLLIFLHEGLGSLSLWRNFPARLCQAAGIQGLVFSRYGYGRSSTRPAEEQWGGDFMQVQALELIPAFLEAVGVPPGQEPWLFGHSDGGSIALIMAAHDPARYAGVIVVAPHTSIEPETAQGVAGARQSFLEGTSRAALERHHADAQSVVTGWANSWLTPAGLAWSIEPLLASITCPVLAIQGEQDAFGTVEQVRVIQRHAPQTQLLELKECGHVPHFQDPQTVIRACTSFIRSVSAARAAQAAKISNGGQAGPSQPPSD